MNKQSGDIRKNLESIRKQLLAELGTQTGQDSSTLKGKEGAATAYQELNNRTACLNAICERLAEVEIALNKLKNGTYRICSACSRPISSARLAALPHATLCIDCKSAGSKAR